MPVAAVGDVGECAASKSQQRAVSAFCWTRCIPPPNERAHRAQHAAAEQPNHVYLMRGLTVNYTAARFRVQLFWTTRTIQKIGVIQRVNHAHLTDSTAVDNLPRLEHGRIKAMAGANDQRAFRSAHRSNGKRALIKRDRHRFFEQNVLAIRCRQGDMLRMKLMRRSDVDQLNIFISTQRFSRRIGSPGKILLELQASHSVWIARGHELHPMIALKSIEHQGECSAQPNHAHANRCRAHRSSTSSPVAARETHTKM